MDFSKLKILCVGDVMLDRFIYGDMERISPEAPVPVIRRSGMQEMLGGAGNVANNVAALGGSAFLVGLVGTDEAAQRISEHIGALPRAHANLVASASRPTTCKTRLIAAHQQVIRIDEESRDAPDDTERDALVAATLPWIDRVDAVILSDYNKGVLSPAVIEQIIRAARKVAVPIFVDPKTPDFSRYRGATCIKPNLKELALASGAEVRDEASIASASRRLLEQADAQAILVTRSEHGMMLVTANDVYTVPARTREVFDVSGAGDTAIAAFALSFALGRSFVQATHIANAAAGVVVTKLGTAAATMPEVLRELAAAEPLSGPAAMPGLRTLPDARALVAGWKQQGLSVGFTNGCFDVLHTGHIVSLSYARGTCDRLIVALNSDTSVRGLKGPTRPINTLELRANVVAALRDVDCVVAFDEATPRGLISELLPDVLVKGGDYDVNSVVGADIVQAAGGKVVLTPFIEGQSTTRLIEQMQRGVGDREPALEPSSNT